MSMVKEELFLFLQELANKRGKVKVTLKVHKPGRFELTTQTVTVKRDEG
ncbi:MAG: hypothetical protein Ct9H90mP20_0530 [Candidatus Neomarinimicrobiota bacterium]|nr:MAG: hypothetical protein Ct9H90mP20_0530 [Candidatus Neomarinimicrobiota bacterium]